MDLARELEHIHRRGYRFWQEQLGEVVLWAEYDAVNSEYHNVYDEGGRSWMPWVAVPTLWVSENEDEEVNVPEGRKFLPTLRLAVPVRTIKQAGVSQPLDANRHLNDLLFYHRAVWAIGDYQVRGRLRQSVIVGINAVRVEPEEDMQFDNLVLPAVITTTRRPRGYPNDPYPEIPPP